MKIRKFERTTPESVGIPSEAILSLLDELDAADYCEPHGLMIMRWGKICTEGWWAPYAAKIPHTMFSVTKTFTATALGIAYTEGLLTLDDYIIDYFPEYEGLEDSRFISGIKVRDALMMTSGKPEIRCSTADWNNHFFKLPSKYEPGTEWAYSCEDTHLIMALVQKVTDKPMNIYLEEKLFTKIGINPQNIHWAYLPDNSPIGCGGLFATTEDIIRIMKLYLDGGCCEGERILAQDYVELATSTQINIEFEHGILDFAEEGCKPGYAYQIWTDISGICGTYAAHGALGQFGVVLPQFDIIIAYNGAAHNENALKAILPIVSTLKSVAQTQPLPDNKKMHEALKRRLKNLALPSPDTQPYSKLATKISGKLYCAIEDTFSLRKDLWKQIADYDLFAPMVGIDKFCFFFDWSDKCVMKIFEQDKEISLNIGIDGLRRLNSYPMDKLKDIDKVLLDGLWVSEEVFQINARWIQTCYSISIAIRFEDSISIVSGVSVNGDFESHPLRFNSYKYQVNKPV